MQFEALIVEQLVSLDEVGNGDVAELDEEDLTFCFPTLDSAKEHANQFAKRVGEETFLETLR